ncbi:MAG TPA: hypothetical protein VMP01_18350 [Pirellulaceae bacterium]|nr:hypothetical protein [Pirellulaceae bacterium]
MANLKTVRLKPNPPGKDRTRRGGASQTQLGAEWIDLQNTSGQSLSLTGVAIYHIAYGSGHPNGQWEKVTDLSGSVPANQTLRVHSGSGPLAQLRPEDIQGAELHRFTNRDQFVWNNAEGDCAALTMAAKFDPFDKACYDPNPPEGVVLVRQGDKLVVSTVSAAYARR